MDPEGSRKRKSELRSGTAGKFELVRSLRGRLRQAKWETRTDPISSNLTNRLRWRPNSCRGPFLLVQIQEAGYIPGRSWIPNVSNWIHSSRLFDLGTSSPLYLLIEEPPLHSLNILSVLVSQSHCCSCSSMRWKFHANLV